VRAISDLKFGSGGGRSRLPFESRWRNYLRWKGRDVWVCVLSRRGSRASARSSLQKDHGFATAGRSRLVRPRLLTVGRPFLAVDIHRVSLTYHALPHRACPCSRELVCVSPPWLPSNTQSVEPSIDWDRWEAMRRHRFACRPHFLLGSSRLGPVPDWLACYAPLYFFDCSRIRPLRHMRPNQAITY